MEDFRKKYEQRKITDFTKSNPPTPSRVDPEPSTSAQNKMESDA
jgi:hypothetical protein